MFDILVKYQAIVFVNLQEIVPSPDVISNLLSLFRDENFVPNTFQEISKSGAQARVRFSSLNNEWAINFGTDRIIIDKNPIDPKGNNLGRIEDFIAYACKLFNLVLNQYKKKGNRIALITSGLLKEMTNEQLNGVYKKLFNPIAFYGNNPPFEWKSRSVASILTEINGAKEELNVLTDINRVRGQIMQPTTVMDFDRIEIGFDINTKAENKETRFAMDLINSFYINSIGIRNELLGGISKWIPV